MRDQLTRRDVIDYLAWAIQKMEHPQDCRSALQAIAHVMQAIRVAARGRSRLLSEREKRSICDSIVDARDALAGAGVMRLRIALEELYSELGCARLLAGPLAEEVEAAAEALRREGRVELEV